MYRLLSTFPNTARTLKQPSHKARCTGHGQIKFMLLGSCARKYVPLATKYTMFPHKGYCSLPVGQGHTFDRLCSLAYGRIRSNLRCMASSAMQDTLHAALCRAGNAPAPLASLVSGPRLGRIGMSKRAPMRLPTAEFPSTETLRGMLNSEPQCGLDWQVYACLGGHIIKAVEFVPHRVSLAVLSLT